MTIITIVCQTCGKVLGTRDGGGVEGISHSTCEKCLREKYSDIFTEEEIQEILNSEDDIK